MEETKSTLKVEIDGSSVWIRNTETNELAIVVMAGEILRGATFFVNEGTKKPAFSVLWNSDGKLIKREEY